MRNSVASFAYRAVVLLNQPEYCSTEAKETTGVHRLLGEWTYSPCMFDSTKTALWHQIEQNISGN